jgi:hypothetical protein
MIIENTNTHVTLCPKYTHGTHRRQHIISLSAALQRVWCCSPHENQIKKKQKQETLQNVSTHMGQEK